MAKRTGNIENITLLREHMDHLRLMSDDADLCDYVGEYMKGFLDGEEVKNDPDYFHTNERIKEMISDYSGKTRNRENEKFIADGLAQANSDILNDCESDLIEEDIANNNINEMAAELVKEFQNKKISIEGNSKKVEEISAFVKSAMSSRDGLSAEPRAEARKNTVKTTPFAKYVSLAAAAVLGAFILIKTLLPSSDPDKIFSKYYKSFDPVSTVTRSLNSEESQILASAIGNYRSSSFQKAAVGFASLLEKYPAAVSAQFLLGLTQMELKNYDQAIGLLSVVASKSAEYSKEAKWYLGLAYLKSGNKEKASEYFSLLSASDGYYSEGAEKILRRLK